MWKKGELLQPYIHDKKRFFLWFSACDLLQCKNAEAAQANLFILLRFFVWFISFYSHFLFIRLYACLSACTNKWHNGIFYRCIATHLIEMDFGFNSFSIFFSREIQMTKQQQHRNCNPFLHQRFLSINSHIFSCILIRLRLFFVEKQQTLKIYQVVTKYSVNVVFTVPFWLHASSGRADRLVSTNMQ